MKPESSGQESGHLVLVSLCGARVSRGSFIKLLQSSMSPFGQTVSEEDSLGSESAGGIINDRGISNDKHY